LSETRKIAAILVADIVGFSRLAGADEDRILARLRALHSDLIDPTIALHHGRIVKRTGDGSLIEFRSVVDAVRCARCVSNCSPRTGLAGSAGRERAALMSVIAVPSPTFQQDALARQSVLIGRTDSRQSSTDVLHSSGSRPCGRIFDR
jgi:class 3 adenylate cyclase